MPITIIATAIGSLNPPLDDYSNFVKNGDFAILATAESVVGDGHNEWTIWKFDFTEDPNFKSFSASAGKLTSAQLTLVLEPKNEAVETDSVGICGSKALIQRITSPFQSLEVGQVKVLKLELLKLPDLYDTDVILEAFNGVLSTTYKNKVFHKVIYELLPEERRLKEEGQILMFYEEDSIICFAELVLRREDA